MLNTLINLFRLPAKKRSLLHGQILSLTGFMPVNIDLYRCALTHKSLALVTPEAHTFNNERLEYLGDAILSAAIADFLYSEYPDSNEGFLTKMRSKLVNRENLNNIAIKMGFDQLVLLENKAIPTKKHIYGNALEAIIGAIYIDKGYNMSKGFIIEKIIKSNINLYLLQCEDTDFKSQIIQWGQKNKQEISFESYELTEEDKPRPVFTATIHICDMVAGEGVGTTKKEAQQHAAKQALKNITS